MVPRPVQLAAVADQAFLAAPLPAADRLHKAALEHIVVADASSCLAPKVLEGTVQELHRLPLVDLGDKVHFQALVDSTLHCSVVQTVDKVQHIRLFYRPMVDTVHKGRMLLPVQVVRSLL